MRKQVDDNERLLVEDKEVNDRQILNHINKGHHYLRNRITSFGCLHTWDGFKNGYCAIDWTLYPDGRYFADEGGFGLKDNDEEVVYCIMARNLNIVVLSSLPTIWDKLTSTFWRTYYSAKKKLSRKNERI